MPEQQVNITSESAIDLALAPEKLRFTIFIAVIWVIPMILMLSFLESANIVLLPLWSLICMSWIFGGISRMSAIELKEGGVPILQDGLNLVKVRWGALAFGPLVFSIVVVLVSSLLFWLINLVSNLSLIGALLIIPTVILVLSSFAIVLNVYLMCTIIGYDDIGLIDTSKKLITIAIKKPSLLYSGFSDLISSTFFLSIISGAIVTSAVVLAIFITGGSVDISSFMSIFQDNINQESAFVGSIRSGSIAIVIVVWLSFLVNVAAITSSITYSGN